MKLHPVARTAAIWSAAAIVVTSLSACVVAPIGHPHAYPGPVVVGPAPVVVAQPAPVVIYPAFRFGFGWYGHRHWR